MVIKYSLFLGAMIVIVRSTLVTQSKTRTQCCFVAISYLAACLMLIFFRGFLHLG